ncbi:MAG TPA: hypothetical protein VK558_09135 [Patescibacteria group bacterium]|nr:hypothetical protein [Patescibacteria group bacterium]
MHRKTIGTMFSLLAAMTLAAPAQAAGRGDETVNAVIVVRHKDMRTGTDAITLLTDSPEACEKAIVQTAIRMAQTNIQSIYAYCLSASAVISREYLCDAEAFGVMGVGVLDQRNLETRKGKLHCQRAEVTQQQPPSFRDNGRGFSLDFEFAK